MTTREGPLDRPLDRPRVAVRPPVEAAGQDRTGSLRRELRWAIRSPRTRILASYVVLLVLSAVVTTFAIWQLLVFRLEARVDSALHQEVLELDRLLADGRDPETGQPFVSLRSVLDIYFARNVPSNDEALLGFVDGALYTKVMAQFPVDEIPADTLAAWEAFSSRLPTDDPGITGTFLTPLGEAHYQASRIWFNGEPGAFVITILPAGELAGIAELQSYGIVASLAVLVVASLVAWLVVGHALRPVRALTETARSISESELTGRIEVRGTDEAAEMAQSFNAMLDRLETVFRSQREFVEDASHELRHPLTICRGQLELLDEDPEDRAATVRLVLDELDRMTRIVDELQLLAESEQPDFLRHDLVDLGDFATELLVKSRALADRDWRVDASEPGVIHADRHRLTEAVMNLVVNAAHHTEKSDVIGIGITVSPTTVSIAVRDTGVGISITDQGKIFERFARGRASHKRYEGSGLGLSIVRAIVEAHGGRVELMSRLGAGSTFTIIIPRIDPDDDDAYPDR
jgi:two-component system, OmpR family, sensor kinase